MICTPRIARAANIAARAHRDQLRADDHRTPYGVHPMFVASIVSEYTDDEDIVIAALFHDIYEDVPDRYTLEQMEKDFGRTVVDLVLDVSEDKSITDYVARKQGYLDHLKTAPFGAKLISAADLLHNTTSAVVSYQDREARFMELFGHRTVERVAQWRERARLLSEALGSDHPLSSRLLAAVEAYAEAAELGQTAIDNA